MDSDNAPRSAGTYKSMPAHYQEKKYYVVNKIFMDNLPL